MILQCFSQAVRKKSPISKPAGIGGGSSHLHPLSIGRDGDLKPIPIAEKTAKNQKRMASVIRFSLYIKNNERKFSPAHYTYTKYWA